ncbi:MAG TPA: nucleotidyltransferase family protein [Candidatus Acidoferrum sp.]
MTDIQAVILCGGLGMRLRDTVPGVPKALAPISGRPFLDFLLAGLAATGVREVVLCTGHGSETIEAEYGNDGRCGLSIRYSVEREALGTGGALKLAQRWIHSQTFLLLNGDSLLDADFEQLLSAHWTSGAIASVALSQVSSPERYGSVTVEANGEIRRFAEKRAATWSMADQMAFKHQLINAGVYALSRNILEMIPDAPPEVSLERDVLPTLIGRGLFGFVSEGFFIDIGVPEDYQRAQTEIPERMNRASTHSR